VIALVFHLGMYPDNFRYTKEHQWVRVDDGIGTVGITFHAQKELGDVVYVDLPKPGAILEQGRAMGSVESVKAVSDIFAPVSGEVIEVNEALAAHPEKLNEDPHGAAWLIKIKLSTPAETAQLLSAADYEKYAGAESDG
jgi:glycine cleavage system H protein